MKKWFLEYSLVVFMYEWMYAFTPRYLPNGWTDFVLYLRVYLSDIGAQRV
jgi:hypothetical protein